MSYVFIILIIVLYVLTLDDNHSSGNVFLVHENKIIRVLHELYI